MPADAPGELRDGFKFRSGHLALDLAATVSGRRKPVPTDALSVPSDLDRWLVAAQLVGDLPHALAAELRGARALREAVFRMVHARLAGAALEPSDVTLLNRMARVAPPSVQLTDDGVTQVGAGVRNLLAVVARAGIALLDPAGALRVRACEGQGCSILFVDASRGGDRRWCSMSACGNRAKLAEFRARRRGEHEAG